MTDFSRLRVTWQDDVTHIELHRPDRRNAIDLGLARELLTACLLDRTADSRAVLLTGRGDHFCVGGDLKSFHGRPDLANHLLAVTSYLHAAIQRLVALPAPLVVAAQGTVAGAGLGLACLADVLLVEQGTTFRSAYGGLGLSPDAATSHLLPRLIGLRRAQRMTLLGHVLTAEEAVSWGLGTELVPAGTLATRAWDTAVRLAAGPTMAFGETARLLRTASHRALTEQLEDESVTLSALASTKDAAEGMAAFATHRKPVFQGSA